jgi:hypothetical protein
MTRQDVVFHGDQRRLAAAAVPFPDSPDQRERDWSPADYIRLLNVNTAKVIRAKKWGRSWSAF